MSPSPIEDLKICIDVHYAERGAAVAGVLFRDWAAAEPEGEAVICTGAPADYEPGEFYRRELPCICALLDSLAETPGVVIVDGYVWLGPDRPGLGARLHAALGGGSAVIGVAKNPFAGAPATPVFRGQSARPLYVTAEGVDRLAAAEKIRLMHGPFRLPALIKRADQLCRDGVV